MNEKFMWGAATAATQIEGGAFDDGKTASCWDEYCKIPNLIYEGQDCSVACDSYHKYKEDIKLLKELGVSHYRFSIAWTRILPFDSDEINSEGIRYYNNLINELLANNIIPLVTIYHWDMPSYIYKNGGWLNKNIVKYFERYTKVVMDNFADRVKTFVTINEPQCCLGGLGGVEQRPYTTKEKLQMVHNLLLCNGVMTRIVKSYGCKATIAICGGSHVPYNKNNKEDVKAAFNAQFDVHEGNTWETSIYLDPIMFGKYPDKYYKVHKKSDLPKITEEDMNLIHTGLDFIGLNVYFAGIAKHTNDENYEIVKYPPGTSITTMEDWHVNPDCIYYGLKNLYERYNVPVAITENGTAVTDIVTKDNKIHDSARSEYIKIHIQSLLDCIRDGVDVRGYFYWSLLDNFEWKHGYSQRFGIVRVDYQNNQARYKKDSFFTYKRIIRHTHIRINSK